MNTTLARFLLIAALLGFCGGWNAAAQPPPPAAAAVPHTQAANQGGPRIQFAESEDDFGRI